LDFLLDVSTAIRRGISLSDLENLMRVQVRGKELAEQQGLTAEVLARKASVPLETLRQEVKLDSEEMEKLLVTA
jgi:hypothetical protein